MKKVIFSFAILSLVFATSCGGDDDTTEDDGCQTCAAFEIEVNGETQTSPAVEVCEGDNGNAFVDGVDSGQEFDQYIELAELFTECN